MQHFPFVALASTGLAFRAASFCMAYVILAKGDGRIYVVTEFISAAAYLLLNILLFEEYGFAGLGAAYIAWYICYTAIVYAVYHFRYRMHLRSVVIRLLAIVAIAGSCAVVSDYYAGPWWTAGIMLPPSLLLAVKAIRQK